MNNKGFSLIELLAVIVLIAIIALITTPIVLNVINDSSENVFTDDAMSLSKAADNYYTASYLENDIKLPLLITFNEGKETNKFINNDTQKCETSNERMLEYSGKNPDSGNIYIDKNSDVYMAIYNKKSRKCAIKNPEDKTITITDKTIEECKLDYDPCETY